MPVTSQTSQNLESWAKSDQISEISTVHMPMVSLAVIRAHQDVQKPKRVPGQDAEWTIACVRHETGH